MLILDEQRIARNLKGLAQEKTADEINSWCVEQWTTAYARSAGDLAETASNPQRQLGSYLPNPAKLEEQLLKYCPTLIFKQHNTSKKTMDQERLGEPLFRVCVYEAGFTPEYSIMNCKYQWIPDPDYALGKRTFERDEAQGKSVSNEEAYNLIVKLGMEGASQYLLEQRQDKDVENKEYRPGFKKVLGTGSEAVRGWRTVLAYVMQKGLITVSQANAIVAVLGGGQDRQSWALRTGTQSDLKRGF